ncbi:MAG: protein kinase, partial [Steroidobacteraceae bacterium]
MAEIAGRALQTRYALREKLGTGGQGEVWRAYDSQRGGDVAMKVLHAAAARSDAAWAALVREHALASRLDHPSILKVFPPERAGSDLLLPMELAAGGDLRRLRGAGFLLLLPVLIEVAQALEHAHARGVIHRDLKPGNVLFDAQGRAKLADFGASGIADAGGDPSSRASPFSASPQQLRGEPATPADDIYGLGALAYELLSHHPPHYPHFDPRRVQEEPVPELQPAEPIPPRLGALVMRMLEKDAARRPASMSEVIEQFDVALNDTLDLEEWQPPATVGAANGTLPPDERITSTRPVPSGAVPVAVKIPTVLAAVPPPVRVHSLAPVPTPPAGRVTAPPAAFATAATTPGIARIDPDVTPAAPRGARPPAPAPIEPGSEVVSPHLPWEGLLPPSRTSPLMRLEPMPTRSGAGFVLLALVAAALFAAWYWLPQYSRDLPPELTPLARSLRPDAFPAASPAQPANDGAAA